MRLLYQKPTSVNVTEMQPRGRICCNVVQSTRAVISVGIAFLACKLLKAGVEQSVGLSLWLRRLAAAILMTGGIILYSLFR